MMNFRNNRVLAALLAVVLVMGTFGALNVNAQRYSGRYYRGGHHSKTKGALIGAAAGLIGGGLIGGKGGALIGAGAGAGTGYLIQSHKNHHNRRYRGYYRRY